MRLKTSASFSLSSPEVAADHGRGPANERVCECEQQLCLRENCPLAQSPDLRKVRSVRTLAKVIVDWMNAVRAFARASYRLATPKAGQCWTATRLPLFCFRAAQLISNWIRIEIGRKNHDPPAARLSHGNEKRADPCQCAEMLRYHPISKKLQSKHLSGICAELSRVFSVTRTLPRERYVLLGLRNHGVPDRARLNHLARWTRTSNTVKAALAGA